MRAYPPSEDSFLLAEVVKQYHGETAIEIGVGSGYVMEELAQRSRYAVGTDLDIEAIKEAKDKLLRAGVWGHADLVCCDRATPFLNGAFDLVIFNPPYLPSRKLNDLAVDGGRGGVAVVEGFFGEGARVLKGAGKLVFLASSLSDYGKLFSNIKSRGFKIQVVGRKRLFFEELMAVEAAKRQAP